LFVRQDRGGKVWLPDKDYLEQYLSPVALPDGETSVWKYPDTYR